MSTVCGTIGYTVSSGLGNLVRMFFEERIIQRILRINHPCYQNSIIYPDGVIYRNSDDFLQGLDTLIIFENAFNYWNVVQQAKEKMIKIVLIPMYEYTPFPTPVTPDYIACPSLLDLEIYKNLYNLPCNHVPIPIDRKVTWRLRDKAEIYIHNAGHGGKDYRNGTVELIQAMEYVRPEIKLILRFQSDSKQMNVLYERYKNIYKNIEWVQGEVPFEELYNVGDVFVFPEKFNGLSLPLQESFASGMLVMATNRFPNNTYLREEPLIPVSMIEKKKIAITFDCYYCDPIQIAYTMNEWYDKDILEYSISGRHYAYQNSWDVLKEIWLKVIG